MTWLVLDTSPSMTFGTAERRKADVAEGAALASATPRRGAATGSASSRSATSDPRTLPARQGAARPARPAARAAQAEPASGRGARRRDLGRRGAAARRQPRPPARATSSVVSDFRGPRDWRRPLLDARRPPPRRGGRDPRRARAGAAEARRAVARRPRDRPAAEGRHARASACARGSPPRRREERREVAAEIASAGARHVVLPTRGDWLRDADRLPAARGGAMSFASPLALLALLLVPLAAAGYVLFQRRRVREAARFVEPALLPNVVDRVARLAAAPACRAPAARRRGVPGRLRAAARHLVGALGGGDARSSRSTRRARWARPTSSRRGSPPRRRSARRFLDELPDEVPRRGRRLQHAGAGRRRRRRRTASTSRAAIARCASARRRRSAMRSRRPSSVARGRRRRRSSRGRSRRRPSILVLSDGAVDGGRVKLRRGDPRARDGEDPVFTALLGTQAGVVEVPRIGGYVERIQVPPDPTRCAGSPTQTGGSFFAAPTEERSRRRLRRPQVAARHTRRRTRRSRSRSPRLGALLLLVGCALSALWFRRVP